MCSDSNKKYGMEFGALNQISLMNEARLDQISSNVFTQQAAVIKTMSFKGTLCIFVKIIVSPLRRM